MAMVEPNTVITAIGAGLKQIDQARDLVLRYRNRPVSPPSATAEQTQNSIKFKRGDQLIGEVKDQDLKLDQWDSVRYDALRSRVDLNFGLFSELWLILTVRPPEEVAGTRIRMEQLRKELCEDFSGMRDIYERTLNMPLADHYTLYEFCAD